MTMQNLDAFSSKKLCALFSVISVPAVADYPQLRTLRQLRKADDDAKPGCFLFQKTLCSFLCDLCVLCG